MKVIFSMQIAPGRSDGPMREGPVVRFVARLPAHVQINTSAEYEFRQNVLRGIERAVSKLEKQIA